MHFLTVMRNRESLTAIFSDEDFAPMLFPPRTVSTDAGHASRVLRKNSQALPLRRGAAAPGHLTCMDEKEIRLYRLVVKLFAGGRRFSAGFLRRNPAPCGSGRPASQRRGPSAERGFIRFSELGGVLGSEIEPKNRVLPVLRSHFCSRYQNEKIFHLRPHPPRGAVLCRRKGRDPSAGRFSDGSAG